MVSCEASCFVSGLSTLCAEEAPGNGNGKPAQQMPAREASAAQDVGLASYDPELVSYSQMFPMMRQLSSDRAVFLGILVAESRAEESRIVAMHDLILQLSTALSAAVMLDLKARYVGALVRGSGKRGVSPPSPEPHSVVSSSIACAAFFFQDRGVLVVTKRLDGNPAGGPHTIAALPRRNAFEADQARRNQLRSDRGHS